MIKEALVYAGKELAKEAIKGIARGLGEVGREGIKAAGEAGINEIKKLPEKIGKKEADSLPDKIDLLSDELVFDQPPTYVIPDRVPTADESNARPESFLENKSEESDEKADRSVLEKNPLEEKNNRNITLPDGTTVEIPNALDTTETKIENLPIQNKQDGLRRESEVEAELKDQYPPEEGYSIEQEVYLRDKDGRIVKDPVTGEARRIDFVVIKDGEVVDSIEVTSKTADKTSQSAKEERIRDIGGNYIKDSDGNLVEIPANVQTRIERRD